MISDPIKKFFQELVVLEKESQVERESAALCVNTVIGKLSFFYEKLRNTLDDVEEHLLRKNAISRYLVRKFSWSFSSQSTEALSKQLLCDLVRANYLENNSIGEKELQEVSLALEKYLLFHHEIIEHASHAEKKILTQWMIQIASCEIEDIVCPSKKRELLGGMMYEFLKNRIQLEGYALSKETKEIQIYIAILRSLRRADEGLLAYYLFQLYFPNWKKANASEIQKIAENFFSVIQEMRSQIYHPLNAQLLGPMKKYSVCLQILLDMARKNPKEGFRTIQLPEEFATEIKMICNSHYRRIKSKITRLVFRSIIYIFVTKMALAIAIEIPYDIAFYSSLNYFALFVNILFPPFLLFFLAISISTPTVKNTQKVIEGIQDFLFSDRNEKIEIKLKAPKKRGFFKRNFFRLFYVVLFVLLFGVIIMSLRDIGFNELSIAFFLFFLCVVSFFSIRLRLRAREFIILERSEGVVSFFADLLSLPFIRVGRWISLRLSKINIFLFILDFLIEAPLKYFFSMLEEWFSFLKEKKEEIY